MLSRIIRKPFGLGFSCLFLLTAVAALSLYTPTVNSARNDSNEVGVNASEDNLSRKRLDTAYGQMEMSFEANRGQTDPSVGFLTRGVGYGLFLKPTEAVFALSRDRVSANRRGPDVADQRSVADETRSVLRLKLLGANAKAGAIGVDELEGKANYFIGNDQSKWRTDVPTYARVRYIGVYDGVDVEYYGSQRQLEYDFRVTPGADYRKISLKFAGADSVKIEEETGDLLIGVDGQTVRQHKPFIYQEVAGERQVIDGRFVVSRDGKVGFAVDKYDASIPLVIDPVLVYSTFMGGNGDDVSYGTVVDTAGNAYITGYTTSTNFPITNPIQGTRSGGFDDVFVTKINTAGSAVVYSTYLGGNGSDEGYGIAVDAGGNIYVTGSTYSTNFPTASPYQGTHSDGNNPDAFVAKIGASGSALVYSTYLGGNNGDIGYDVAVDQSGNAYLVGTTQSSNFPTASPLQGLSGGSDAFVTKLDATGTALAYSTYVGGTSNDVGTGIALDPAGNAYLTGSTASTNFPMVNPIQGTTIGFSAYDAFVAKINTTGSALVYSTYLGGNPHGAANYDDFGRGIAVDAAGNAYVVGEASSPDFLTRNPIQAANAGASDAFVAKIDAAGSALVYSTYLGGSSQDRAYGVSVDSAGNVFVTGTTNSTDFPTHSAIQSVKGALADVFVTKINAAGSALTYSTYLGGGGDETAYGVATDPAGNAYVTGSTASSTFPTAGPIRAYAGGTDAFISKIEDIQAPTPTPSPTPGASGHLDTAFGTGGKTVATIANVFGWPAAAVQSTGKVVFAAGVVGPDNFEKFAVVRLASNGSVDTAFGNGGFVTMTFNTFPAREIAYTVAVQSDDKILIAGAVETSNGFFDLAVARLNTDGSLDPTFGSGGKVTIPVTAGNDFPSDIKVQTNGAILLAGRSRPTPNFDASLVRLTVSGQLDGSFNGTGIKVLAIGPGASNDEFAKLTVQPDGKIVAVGNSVGATGTDQDFVTMRFNSNGSVDSAFGSGGKVLTPVGTQHDRANSIALQSDGRILVGGAANSGSSDFAALVRFNSNGSLDPSFGSSGKLTIDSTTNKFAIFNSLLIQSDGKILAIGSGPDVFGGGDFKLARFDQTGTPDPDFGLGGFIRTKFGTNDSFACCGFIQSGNTLLVAGQGQANDGAFGFAVARYLLSSALSTFSISGRVVTAEGSGLKNAVVTLTDPQNVTRQAVTGPYGNYIFTGVLSGQTYNLAVSSRRQFTFTPQSVLVTSDLTGVNFVAQ